MNNYREQNGCWNCRKVYKLLSYDGPTQIFCNKNKDRPKDPEEICETIHIKDFASKEAYRKERRRIDQIWQDWENIYRTEQYGICDDHPNRNMKNMRKNESGNY